MLHPDAVVWHLGLAVCAECRGSNAAGCVHALAYADQLRSSDIIRSYRGLDYYVPDTYSGKWYGQYLLDVNEDDAEAYILAYRVTPHQPGDLDEMDPATLVC